MNGELPPADPGIREQLARRSAGRLPDSLLADVSAAVDAVSLERPRRLRLGPAAIGAPRLAAAASLALVVVIAAALVVVPHFMTSPAASTSYTALTTSELAHWFIAWMPPAVNTTIVATVTIDSRNDVCPMNRYPTLGVIEGMGSQVCVMGMDLNTSLSADRVSAAKVTGTFAFRYLAPGYLGLVGQLTLPATGLTFRATDEWPLQGRTFLVEGWLGADGLMESCLTTPTSGDVLLPNGDDCPYDNWLGTDSTAPGIAADHGYAAGSPLPSYDPLALRGNARHVQASGMRLIDGIDYGAPVHGVYVVRSVTSACPYASPIDSRGCGVWRVLARVSDTSLHAPTVTPAATAAPTGVYPAFRALTRAELTQLMAGMPVTNMTFVADVTIDASPDACPMDGRVTIGVIQGLDQQVCVVGATGSNTSLASGETLKGIFAFRYLAHGYVGMVGLITPASSSKLAFDVADDWSRGGKTFLVSGWLGATAAACTPVPSPMTAVDPLDPDGADGCESSWLSDNPNADASAAPNGSVAPAPRRFVQAGGARSIDGISGGSPVYGIFVVRPGNGQACGFGQASDPGCPRVLAVVPVITNQQTATASLPAPTPTGALPATPITPVATPTIAAGGSPIGLLGIGNRPLTGGEFASLWAADPAHLAGRIVVAKGPVPTGFQCRDAIWEGKPADAPCVNVSSQGGYIAQDGYWAIRVGADGKLSIVGQISTPTTGFVYSLDQLNASTSLKNGDLVMVSGWLLEHVPTCDFGATPFPSGCGPFSALESTASDNSPAGIGVQLGAYAQFTGTPGDWKVEGPPVEGVFLVRVTNGDTGTIPARLEVAIP